jgi:hypothetical protein
MARTKSGEKKKRQASVQKRDGGSGDSGDEFEVEKIVGTKGAGKNLMYMVKWKVNNYQMYKKQTLIIIILHKNI